MAFVQFEPKYNNAEEPGITTYGNTSQLVLNAAARRVLRLSTETKVHLFFDSETHHIGVARSSGDKGFCMTRHGRVTSTHFFRANKLQGRGRWRMLPVPANVEAATVWEFERNDGASAPR